MRQILILNRRQVLQAKITVNTQITAEHSLRAVAAINNCGPDIFLEGELSYHTKGDLVSSHFASIYHYCSILNNHECFMCLQKSFFKRYICLHIKLNLH